MANYKTISELYHSYLDETNSLCHFGIKGMKWGVRRFQNEDGSLTQEGKERYYKEYTKTDFFGGQTSKNTIIEDTKKNYKKFNNVQEARKKLIEADSKYSDLLYDINNVADDGAAYNLDPSEAEAKDPKYWQQKEMEWATNLRDAYVKTLSYPEYAKIENEYNKTKSDYDDKIEEMVKDLLGDYSKKVVKPASKWLPESTLGEKFKSEMFKNDWMFNIDNELRNLPPISEIKKMNPIEFVQNYTYYQFMD